MPIETAMGDRAWKQGILFAIIPRMVLSVSANLQKRIDERVESGKYRTAEDVLAAALASLDQQEQLTELASSDLEILFPGMKQKIRQGLQDANSGKLSDGEEFFDELEREEKSP
jgi:Arc/MetJ-type ribon-helix-helix transcriptional regulator